MNAMTEPLLFKQGDRELVSFATDPSRYRHWTIAVEGDVARLKLDIDEDGGIKPGYKLKLNSYDLGVDIELYDALNRIRFEHPQVKVVVFESAKEKIWCSGANIYMLGLSTHAWKVNFCKFTNETRNGLEDSSRHDGLKSLAAVTGACAGGGYELALACDRIAMVDDRASTVSLPEVPLLGVLPGTGGPHARHRQAQGAARPRRHLLHHQRRRAGGPRPRLETGRLAREASAVRATRRRRDRSAARAVGPRRRHGHRVDAARGDDRR